MIYNNYMYSKYIEDLRYIHRTNTPPWILRGAEDAMTGTENERAERAFLWSGGVRGVSE